MPKVPRHLHQADCFQEEMLEFDGPMGQCFSRFPTVSSRRRGEKRKKDTGLTRRVNSNSHISHLQPQTCQCVLAIDLWTPSYRL